MLQPSLIWLELSIDQVWPVGGDKGVSISGHWLPYGTKPERWLKWRPWTTFGRLLNPVKSQELSIFFLPLLQEPADASLLDGNIPICPGFDVFDTSYSLHKQIRQEATSDLFRNAKNKNSKRRRCLTATTFETWWLDRQHSELKQGIGFGSVNTYFKIAVGVFCGYSRCHFLWWSCLTVQHLSVITWGISGYQIALILVSTYLAKIPISLDPRCTNTATCTHTYIR